MSVPSHLKYTSDHEWLAIDGDVATIGVTAFAADALGDVVYVNLPDVGSTVTGGDSCGELESTKSVSDIYAPVSGTVVARNESLDATPELVNNDPYGGGWLFDVTVSDASSLDALLDSAAYQASLES